jgi:hypothetical protein
MQPQRSSPEQTSPDSAEETLARPSGRRRRWVLGIGVLALVLSLVVAMLGVVHRSDLAAEQTAQQLQPGMTRFEARQILKDLPYVDAVRKGDGELFFYGNGEWVFLTIQQNRVTRVEHQPDDGPAWDRMRRKWDRVRRSWQGRFRQGSPRWIVDAHSAQPRDLADTSLHPIPRGVAFSQRNPSR